MRFERVLLVQPAQNVEWPGLTPPIGLGYLAQALAEHGIEYEVFDMNLGHGLKQLVRRIEEYRPDLLGMSMITREYYGFYRILQTLKEQIPTMSIVAGGPHVTIFKERVLEECAAVDYGIAGEGEGALVELCQDRLAESEVRGLLYRRGEQIAYSGDRELVNDLDTIAWPRFEKFELRRYFHEISIHTSRGCPFRCIFCARHVITPRFRARSPANVVDEIEYWHRRGYRKFTIEDDNFNLLTQRVYAICDEIERRGLHGLTLRCSNGIRADRADRAMLSRMRDVGFRYLAFGVDAGNNRMLSVVRKGETMEDIEKAIRTACELGYSIKLFFVVGNPTETVEDVEDMVRLCRRHPIQEVHFNNVVPYPGTDLYNWIEKNGYFLRQPSEYLNNASFWEKRAIFETPELPERERNRLTGYLHRVRDQVHRQAIARMFGRHALMGRLAGRLLSNRWLERHYYQSAFWRGMVERFRYRLAHAE